MNEQALKLLIELINSSFTPFVPSEIDGDLSCVFCGGWLTVNSDLAHEIDCFYVQAKKLVKSVNNGT